MFWQPFELPPAPTQSSTVQATASAQRASFAVSLQPAVVLHAGSVQEKVSTWHALLLGTCVTPVAAAHESAVHEMLSLVLTAVFVQTFEPLQASVVQRLLSLHFAGFALVHSTQLFVAGLQTGVAPEQSLSAKQSTHTGVAPGLH